MAKKTIYIGCDHGALELKNSLVAHLKKKGFTVKDQGTQSEDSVDYPDFHFAVAEGVAKDLENNAGVVICKSGIGASICANKVNGIRAALVQTKQQALMSRRHNNANILAIGANELGPKEAGEIFDAWINEPFEGGRHQRRLDKITAYEQNRKG